MCCVGVCVFVCVLQKSNHGDAAASGPKQQEMKSMAPASRKRSCAALSEDCLI